MEIMYGISIQILLSIIVVFFGKRVVFNARPSCHIMFPEYDSDTGALRRV